MEWRLAFPTISIQDGHVEFRRAMPRSQFSLKTWRHSREIRPGATSAAMASLAAVAALSRLLTVCRAAGSYSEPVISGARVLR